MWFLAAVLCSVVIGLAGCQATTSTTTNPDGSQTVTVTPPVLTVPQALADAQLALTAYEAFDTKDTTKVNALKSAIAVVQQAVPPTTAQVATLVEAKQAVVAAAATQPSTGSP
jgi:phage major head subunit gpT-like protein